MGKQERKSAAKAVTDSAQKIWLAGLGAFAKAQAEGSRLFEQLIREGAELEQQTRKYTKDHLAELRGQMESTAERLRRTSQSSIDRIQSMVDERIAQTIERMAVPTREELNRLAEQMSAMGDRYAGAAATAAGASDDDDDRAHGNVRSRGAAPAKKRPTKASSEDALSASRNTMRSTSALARSKRAKSGAPPRSGAVMKTGAAAKAAAGTKTPAAGRTGGAARTKAAATSARATRRKPRG